jgi:hypothetical protein
LNPYRHNNNKCKCILRVSESINRKHPRYVVTDKRIKKYVKEGDVVLTCSLFQQQNFNLFQHIYIIGYFRQVPYNAIPPFFQGKTVKYFAF